MRDPDWTERYPFVQALLQRPDDMLLYEDGVGDATPWFPNPGGAAAEPADPTVAEPDVWE